MSDLEISGLDDRIRDLVARAVADAPPAPTIDERTLEESAMLRPNTQPPSDRNRWIVGGIAGLSVAAAVVALVFVTRPDDPEVPGPGHAADHVRRRDRAGHDHAAPTPAPTLGTGDRTARRHDPPGAGDRPGHRERPHDRTDPAVLDESIVIATFDGIQIDTGDAVTNALVGLSGADRATGARRSHLLPAPVARPARHLRVLRFRHRRAPVELPADFTGQPVLHDAAVVNGEVVLLVESAPAGPCTDPSTCLGSIWAIWPDRGTGVKLDEQIVWEAGYSQLSLSATGVVVGMKSAEVSSSPWSVAIPGATAAPLDPVAVGLEVDYVDCSTCPRALTIDSTGRFVGWIKPPAPTGRRRSSSSDWSTG